MSYTPTPAFSAAQATVSNLEEPQGNEIMLLAYALFKQTTTGDVEGARPGILNQKERKKYDTRVFIQGMAREKADELYINCSNHMANGEALVEENQELLERIKSLFSWT